MKRLEIHAAGVVAGVGWSRPHLRSAEGNAQFLRTQLSERCRQRSWWAELSTSLSSVESDPVVYLHGDLKAEHFLVTDDEVYVVDWEACGRGPAVSDRADVVFHLVRDLLYEGATDRHLPIGLLSELEVPGNVLAWRLVRWLDRRRPHDLDLVAPRDLHELVDALDPTAACKNFARIVTALRMVGVPR